MVMCNLGKCNGEPSEKIHSIQMFTHASTSPEYVEFLSKEFSS
jgi:hypothetical protein